MKIERWWVRLGYYFTALGALVDLAVGTFTDWPIPRYAFLVVSSLLFIYSIGPAADQWQAVRLRRRMYQGLRVVKITKVKK